jgi:hypothetical protein
LVISIANLLTVVPASSALVLTPTPFRPHIVFSSKVDATDVNEEVSE